MADVNGPVCLNHPDRASTARCAACGKCICDECIVSRAGVSYCSVTCADNAQRTQGAVDCALAGKKRADSRRKVRLFIAVVIFLAIILGLVLYLQKQGDQDKALFKQLGKDLDSTLNSAKKTIQKSVPTDSSYKKNREGLVK